MRLLTNLSLSLLLLLLLFTHTRMVVCSDEVESQHLEARQVEEVDVEPVDAVDSMLGSGEFEIDDGLHPARWEIPPKPRHWGSRRGQPRRGSSRRRRPFLHAPVIGPI
uniref:APJ endogenous ligand n=1 Tax=Mesocestoides corti TaxID=53468 RepID=A0A5K3FW90_MESCO